MSEHRSSLLASRAAAIVAAVVCFAIVVFAFAGISWSPAIVRVLLFDGSFAWLWVLSGAALGDLVLGAIRAKPGGVFGFASAAGIGIGLQSLAVLALGLAGVMTRPAAIGGPIVLVAIWLAVHAGVARRLFTDRPAVEQRIRHWLRQPAGWGWLCVAIVALLSLSAVGATLLPAFLWKPHDPHPYDVLSYHLLVPREWYEAGRITPLAHNAFSFFPFAAEMGDLWAMYAAGGPWPAMYACALTSLAYTIVLMVAIHEAARRFTDSPAAPVLATLAAAATPWVLMLGSVAYVEPLLLLEMTIALAWVCRAAESTERRWRTWAIAGACAGLSCGAKLTAGPMLLAAVPAVVVAEALFRRRDVSGAVGGAAIFMVVGSLLFSPWLIRNAIWSHGNPFFPNALTALGAGGFSPGQVERSQAAYEPPAGERSIAGRLGAVGTQILWQWQFGYVLLPLAIAGVLLARRRPAGMLLGGVFVLQLIFWAGFTHLISRFFVPAIPTMALMIGLVPWRRTGSACVAILLLLGAGMTAIGVAPKLSAVANLADGGLFGINSSDLGRFLYGDEVTDLVNRGDVIHLVGDAQAFLRVGRLGGPRPTLTYCDVFNVDATDGISAIKAWTGKELADFGPHNWAFIDPAEIERLHATYRHIPRVDPGLLARAAAQGAGPADPFLVNGTGQLVVPAR